jgi:hypothetical protein
MPSRSACLAVAACLGLAAGPAFAGGTVAFAPDAGGAIDFVMPSGNIECIYTPPGGTPTYMPDDGGPELSCDRAEPTYLRFILGASGPGAIISNVGDASCCSESNIFAYGRTWRQAPFTCTSSTAGLACRRDDGHGFFISRAKVSAD